MYGDSMISCCLGDFVVVVVIAEVVVSVEDAVEDATDGDVDLAGDVVVRRFLVAADVIVVVVIIAIVGICVEV